MQKEFEKICKQWKEHICPLCFPLSIYEFNLCSFDKKVGKGSNPGEELVFMRAIFCSMYVLNRTS